MLGVVLKYMKKIKLTYRESGFALGISLKRDLTFREASHIWKNILGVEMSTLEDLGDREGYEDYKEEFLATFNDVLKGEDFTYMNNFTGGCDYDDDGLFLAPFFEMYNYLIKRGVV